MKFIVGQKLRCLSWEGLTFKAGHEYPIVECLSDSNVTVVLENGKRQWLPASLFKNFELTDISPCDAGAEEYEEIMRLQQ